MKRLRPRFYATAQRAPARGSSRQRLGSERSRQPLDRRWDIALQDTSPPHVQLPERQEPIAKANWPREAVPCPT